MSPIPACKTQRSTFESTQKEEKLRTVAVVLYLFLFALLISSCGLPAQSATSASAGVGKSSSSPTINTDSSSSHLTVSGNMPNGSTQSPYNTVVSVSGGSSPYQFSTIWGNLPPGLSLNTSTGTISGTPSQSGTYNFSVGATDLPKKDSGDHRFTIVVNQGSQNNITVTISPTSATVNAGGSQQFSATVTGTPNPAVHWKTTAGSITTNGLLTVPATGVASLTVTAMSIADSTKTASAAVTVTSGGGNGNPTITTTSVPDATSGSAYSTTLAATGGTTPYTWSISSGSLPSGLSLSSSTGTISGTTSKTGTFSFTAKVTDAASKSATQPLSLAVSAQNTSGFDGPAELPRVYIQSTLADTPAPGKTIPVASGGDFQGALNSASCGDTITLAQGATYTGAFTLPAKGCDDNHWIIIRTSAPDSSLPAEGTRITPCYAGVSSLPGRPSFNCKSTTNVMAKVNYNVSGVGPILLASGATHYRLLGLEITRSANIGVVYSLASIVANGTADHIFFDRVWMHGTALDETNRGILLGGSTNIAVVDSFFTDFHCLSQTGACTDAQAIAGGIGDLPQGPYKFDHNFFEASAEGFILGGSEAAVTPADIQVTHNHFFKPLIWLQGQPGFIGVVFTVKNHFELKNAQRVLLEGNIMENTWGGFSQTGFSIVITPKNQTSNGQNICPLCQVTDVTVRYNSVSHAGSGMQVANGLSDTGGAPLDGQRYSIHDNILDDIDPVKYTGGNGVFAQVSMGDGTPVLQNVSIVHNTGFAPNQMLNIGDDTNVNPKMANFTFNNNMMNAALYPVWSTGGTNNCAFYDKPATTITACFNGWAFTNNAFIAIPNNSPQSSWPTGNFFPTNTTAVQFVNYNGGNGGDYHLLASSPYKNAGTDGKDLGADVDAILSATANVY